MARPTAILDAGSAAMTKLVRYHVVNAIPSPITLDQARTADSLEKNLDAALHSLHLFEQVFSACHNTIGGEAAWGIAGGIGTGVVAASMGRPVLGATGAASLALLFAHRKLCRYIPTLLQHSREKLWGLASRLQWLSARLERSGVAISPDSTKAWNTLVELTKQPTQPTPMTIEDLKLILEATQTVRAAAHA